MVMKQVQVMEKGFGQEQRPRTSTGRVSARWRWVVAWVLSLWVGIVSANEAFAQEQTKPLPQISLQRFRPAPNPSDYFTVYGSSISPHLKFTGGFYMHASNSPLKLRLSTSPQDQSVVDYQFGADVFASFALYEWVEMGLVIPMMLAQESGTSGEPFDDDPKAAGMGDMRLTIKGKILDLKDFPLGIAVMLGLNFPTATADSFYGDSSFGAEPRLLLDYNPYRSIRLGFNLGYHYRGGGTEVNNFTIGDSVLVAGSASFPFFTDDLDILAELNGAITVASENRNLTAEERPVEFLTGLRWRMVERKGWWKDMALTAGAGFGSSAVGSPDVRVFFGLGYYWVAGGSWQQDYSYGGYLAQICPDPAKVPKERWPAHCKEPPEPDRDGDGVPDSQDRCPIEGVRGQVDKFGCPITNDRDGDGIPDNLDKCPEAPEDIDKFKDTDGCPDLDNDQDQIPDSRDACPLDQEVINGIDDNDGCPDEDPSAGVRVRGGKVEIKEQVFFETSKAVIKQESFKILNEVSDLLIKNPQIGDLDIEGHTDDRGDEAFNKQLSQERAQAVADYIIKRGVAAKRIKAIGYGEEKPVADNESSAGRAKNRRVEFTIRGLPPADDSGSGKGPR